MTIRDKEKAPALAGEPFNDGAGLIGATTKWTICGIDMATGESVTETILIPDADMRALDDAFKRRDD